jgi:hypothetical protein
VPRLLISRWYVSSTTNFSIDPLEKWGWTWRKLGLRRYKPLRIERLIHGVLLDTLHFLQRSKRQTRRWPEIERAGPLPAIHQGFAVLLGAVANGAQGRNRTTDTAIFSPWRRFANHFLKTLKLVEFEDLELLSGNRKLPI